MKSILIFLFLSSACLKTTAKELDFDVKLDNKSEVEFNLTNKSKNNILIQRFELSRNELVFKVIGLNGELIKRDLWRSIDYGWNELNLSPNETFSFSIKLNRMFSNLEDKLGEQCLFLLWGGVIQYKSSSIKKEAHSGALVLNEQICISTVDELAEEF